MRKKKLFIGLLLVSAIVLVASCEKTKDQAIGDIEGTYLGSFTESTELNSALFDGNGEHDGIAVVTMMVDGQIQVHCYGNKIDTTFILNYFEHNDSVMVCNTGDDFENIYGHMLGQGNMNGNMQNNTEWMQHLNGEHQDGDEHFGNFDMQHHLFNYTFKMNNGDFHFQGTKE